MDLKILTLLKRPIEHKASYMLGKHSATVLTLTFCHYYYYYLHLKK